MNEAVVNEALVEEAFVNVTPGKVLDVTEGKVHTHDLKRLSQPSSWSHYPVLGAICGHSLPRVHHFMGIYCQDSPILLPNIDHCVGIYRQKVVHFVGFYRQKSTRRRQVDAKEMVALIRNSPPP